VEHRYIQILRALWLQDYENVKSELRELRATNAFLVNDLERSEHLNQRNPPSPS
jgi:hypothetical protein